MLRKQELINAKPISEAYIGYSFSQGVLVLREFSHLHVYLAAISK